MFYLSILFVLLPPIEIRGIRCIEIPPRLDNILSASYRLLAVRLRE